MDETIPQATRLQPLTSPFGLPLAALRLLGSLKITVALFSLSILLVFFGTLAQMTGGVWTVVDKYFYSWFVQVDLNLFAILGQKFLNLPSSWKLTGSFPFPAGKLLGWALFLNLIAAHVTRFRLVTGIRDIARAVAREGMSNGTWGVILRTSCKVGGMYLIHGGMLLLLLGEYITREFQVEQRMVISEGESSNYAFDTRNAELAFLQPDPNDPLTDRVTVVPQGVLKAAFEAKSTIDDPKLPVTIRVLNWMVNSEVRPFDANDPNHAKLNLSTVEAAKKFVLVPKDEVNGTDQKQPVDMPAAYVQLAGRDGSDLGIHPVRIGLAHETKLADGTVVQLRFQRLYKPYRLELVKFTHELYLGTDLPKNYSSKVRIRDDASGVDRIVDISMNEPLRYAGEAFFQAGFDEEAKPDDQQTTILQVVRNPGWLIPYISCALVGAGMVVYFGLMVVTFASKSWSGPVRPSSKLAAESPESPFVRYAGWAGALAISLYFGSMMVSRDAGEGYDWGAVGRIPVVEGGRVKPLDTVARVAMRQISHRETFLDSSDKTKPAIRWFFDVASAPRNTPGTAADHKVFRIENPQIHSLLGIERRDGYRYSLREFGPEILKLTKEVEKAKSIPDKDRTPFENQVLELNRSFQQFNAIWQGDFPLVMPPKGKLEWHTPVDGEAMYREARLMAIGDAVIEANGGKRPADEAELQAVLSRFSADQTAKLERAVKAVDAEYAPYILWNELQKHYRDGEKTKFAKTLVDYRNTVNASLTPNQRFQVQLESFLNSWAPFYLCTVAYGLALVLALVTIILSLLHAPTAMAMRKATFGVLAATFVVHAIAMLARMYLMDRWLVFVTNLYSSAVFIGCVAVLGGLILERVFPIGLANLVGATVGFGTAIVAHNLALGDTLEMMRAVLDTNFWLATHVTTVTIGYSATYLAGFVGIAYLVLGMFTPELRARREGQPNTEQVLAKMMYSIVCAGTLFSFVGTVLGGIWADQSWGRFWGWDPKENGAVLIVLWNALILHARWGGIVKTRGVAVLAVLGNAVTTWSWFGTNQLGVGLHAYGFNNTLAMFCLVVWISHAAIAAAGAFIPKSLWVSFWKPE